MSNVAAFKTAAHVIPQIEKGIPFPASRKGARARKRPDPRQMDVGDSFFEPLPPDINNAHLGRIMTSAATEGRRLGFRMATRKVVEDGVTGIRVWRLS